jgi:hypothetical protein
VQFYSIYVAKGWAGDEPEKPDLSARRALRMIDAFYRQVARHEDAEIDPPGTSGAGQAPRGSRAVVRASVASVIFEERREVTRSVVDVEDVDAIVGGEVEDKEAIEALHGATPQASEPWVPEVSNSTRVRMLGQSPHRLLDGIEKPFRRRRPVLGDEEGALDDVAAGAGALVRATSWHRSGYLRPFRFASSLRRTTVRISDQSWSVNGVDGSSSLARSRRSSVAFSWTNWSA